MGRIVLVDLSQIALDGADLDVKRLGVRGLNRVTTEEPSSIGEKNTLDIDREVVMGPPVTLDII